MNIMFLVFSFTIGGTEKLLINICNELVKRNINVHLYIVNDLYSEELIKELNKNVHIKLQKRKCGSKKILKTMLLISKYIKNNNINIVHCNSLNSPELLFLTKVINNKIKVFYTIHGINQYCTLNWVKKIYRNFICNKIIAISDSVKKDVIDSGVKQDKIITIYNGINMDKLKLNTERKIDFNNIVVGNVGRIEPSIKGQDILVDAILLLKEKYPNIKCVFGGEAAKKDLKEFVKIKEKIEQHNATMNFKFYGLVNNIPDFLSNIDIFVLPSRFEGFGLSLVEAMACGIPCIASDIAGPKEIINNEKNGVLFENNNAEDLAKKIQYVIENYNELKKNSILKVDEIKHNYNIVYMCNKLVNEYTGGLNE